MYFVAKCAPRDAQERFRISKSNMQRHDARSERMMGGNILFSILTGPWYFTLCVFISEGRKTLMSAERWPFFIELYCNSTIIEGLHHI